MFLNRWKAMLGMSTRVVLMVSEKESTRTPVFMSIE